ncbi:serine hydrolase [Streptomyces sp. NPDC002004]
MRRHDRGRSACPRAVASLALATVLATGGCTGPAGPVSAPDLAGGSASAGPAAAPPVQPPPQLTPAQVDAAVRQLDGVVQSTMRRTGVPGVSVAVVHRDRVVYLKGFGVRKVGLPDRVDPDTVFQLASVSKPLASTVVAGAVGRRTVGWDDPVTEHDPGFALKDPWVTRHVTLADLFSHRSGLPDHAGDLLEDLGYDRAYILRHLRDEPLAPFRASYAYTNFGLTEAAVAAARAAGSSWEELSARTLYRPLGMTSTSSSFADYQRAGDKAAGHVRTDGTWQAKYVRNPQAQSPAGGAYSTARDMARWLRLELGDGRFEGKQVIDAAPLAETYVPHIVAQPPMAPAGRTGFYGLGWDVGYDDHGRLRLSHSGAFDQGAATNVTMLPSEQLGIVVLTNGQPVGVPEAIANDFFDIAQTGRPQVDWLSFIGRVLAQQLAVGRSRVDYAKPPAHPVAARPDSAYTGTYGNGYYGPLTVSTEGSTLVMSLGPRKMRFPLRHYTGNTFSYDTTGENAVGLSGVTFTLGPDGDATKVRVEHLDGNGLGTFTLTSRPVASDVHGQLPHK